MVPRAPSRWTGGFLLLTLCILSVPVWGSSLWSSGRQSDFSDPLAVREGDILTVIVSESTQARSDSEREREKDVEIGGEAKTGEDDATIFHEVASCIPLFGASISGSSQYESERELDDSDSLNTRLSVLVERVRPNGVLELKGKRHIKLSDEVKEVTFTGLARARDVRPDNTIPSSRIANARIYYEGTLASQKGESGNLLGAGWLVLKNILFW